MTDEEKKMVSTVLADCAKRENMTVEEFVAEVLPAFRASYENAKEDHKEFWEGFTPAGVKPTMDEIVIWVAKKLTKKQRDMLEALANELGEEYSQPRSPLQKLRDAFN